MPTEGIAKELQIPFALFMTCGLNAISPKTADCRLKNECFKSMQCLNNLGDI